jgi:hypothetical protein
MPTGTLGNQGSAALVQRACTVQVANLLLECGQGKGLDVSFRAQRGLHVTQGSAKPQPSTCDLRIFGLNPTHRKQLAKSTVPLPGAAGKPIPCIITAGYQGGQAILFSGEMRAANFVSEGPDKAICELSTGDGDQALTQARLNLNIAPGSSAAQVFNQILSALGVQSGNLPKALSQLSANPAAAQLFTKGAYLKGSAAEVLSDLCRSTGLQWSVQSGALQILPLGQPLDGLAIAVDEEHGMIGTPTVDTKGIVTVHTQMIPGIVPGCKIAITSENVSGGFRVIGLETVGDTSPGAAEWGHHIEGQRY